MAMNFIHEVLFDYLCKRFKQDRSPHGLSNQIRYRYNSEIYMSHFCRRQVLRSLSLQNDMQWTMRYVLRKKR